MTNEAAPMKDALGGMISPGDVVANKYRIDRVLRGGGVGVVIEAWHLQLEERVAIKFMRAAVANNAEAVARFEREGRAAFKIRSEYVARVIDVGRWRELPFIVMEYLDGEDLADVLADQRRLPVREAVAYGVQLCAALHAAHSIGVIHRDIKPENLFTIVRADGSPCLKVVDFGLSKVLRPQASSAGRRPRALTMSGRALGTPQYMSPEQWMSAGDVDARADLWAVGVIIYELIAGVTPFAATDAATLCRLILQDDPPSLRSRVPVVSEALDALVMRCLQKRAGDRYPTALALQHALEALTEGLGTAPGTGGHKREPQSSHQRVAAPTAAVSSSAAAATRDATLSPAVANVVPMAPPAAAANELPTTPPPAAATNEDHLHHEGADQFATLVMDPQRASSLRQYAQKMASGHGATVVIGNHDDVELSSLRDGYLAMQQGELPAAAAQPLALPRPSMAAKVASDGHSRIAWVVATVLVVAAVLACAWLGWFILRSG